MIDEIRNVKGFGAPVKTWLPTHEIEFSAMEQIRAASNHPEVGDHLAIMPDCHVGYGVTIGCVFPTHGSIIPNAVGVDIGCGMAAVNTGIPYDRERMDAEYWKSWRDEVIQRIPMGFAAHQGPRTDDLLRHRLYARELQEVMDAKAPYQLGTLGGGNHFLEAQVDQENTIWVMVHSGSRHTGLRIANHYSKLATEQSEKRKLGVGNDLASLLLDSDDGKYYVSDMQWAMKFARESRAEMIHHMVMPFLKRREPYHGHGVIDCLHNYAEGNGDTILHRKGATSARQGQLGIIPGSMGSHSYIVIGKGNDDSFESCSHGAGRRIGRGAAKRELALEDFETALSGTYSHASAGIIDESPMAYKDIDVVMERQADLVDILYTLTPIITIKAGGRDEG
jgi:tRNA-splicing ligase RtcB